MKIKPKKKRNDDGFTLVEVMVVMVIIGIMIGFVVMNVSTLPDEARAKRALADIRTIETMLEQYQYDMFDYPSERDGLEALVEVPAGMDNPERYRAGGYIKRLPIDPWGNPYVYRYPGEHGVYDVLSYGADGESGGEGRAADIVSWEQ